MMELLLIPVALFLAFGNGANDNFKGFATVWGSDTLSYRSALLLATVATVAGSLVSLFLAQELVQQFSGKGLLPEVIVGAPHFIFSVGIGAAITVMIASRAGLPISTTHALIGGLVGAGLAASPGEIQFGRLSMTLLLPLLLSPIIAESLGIVAYRLLRLRQERNDCACVLARAEIRSTSAIAALSIAAPRLVIAEDAACDTLGAPAARFSIAHILDRLHISSAGLMRRPVGCFGYAHGAATGRSRNRYRRCTPGKKILRMPTVPNVASASTRKSIICDARYAHFKSRCLKASATTPS